MEKVINDIPVFDICSLRGQSHLYEGVIAEPFGPYLKVRQKLLIPHKHTFYHVVLFTEGSGTQIIDFEQFDIHPGEIYFMIPGHVHSWEFKSDPDGYIINFSESLFNSFIANPQYLEQFAFLKGIPKDSVIDLNRETLADVIYLFKQIINEVKKKDKFSLDQVYFYLMSLFIRVGRNTPDSAVKRMPVQNQNTLFNFRKLVNQYYTEKKLPKEYAAMLFITPNYLNVICRKELSKSAGAVIRDRILLEAKRLLINMDMSISEIAYQLNFKDNSYFSKFFKKYTSQTPEEFKKQYSDGY
jgi:AraC family transcriptional activator of pobA